MVVKPIVWRDAARSLAARLPGARPGPAAESTRGRSAALHQLGVVKPRVPPDVNRPKPTTSRPWPWPRHWACAHFGPLPPRRAAVCHDGTAGAGPSQRCPRHRAIPRMAMAFWLTGGDRVGRGGAQPLSVTRGDGMAQARPYPSRVARHQGSTTKPGACSFRLRACLSFPSPRRGGRGWGCRPVACRPRPDPTVPGCVQGENVTSPSRVEGRWPEK